MEGVEGANGFDGEGLSRARADRAIHLEESPVSGGLEKERAGLGTGAIGHRAGQSDQGALALGEGEDGGDDALSAGELLAHGIAVSLSEQPAQ